MTSRHRLGDLDDAVPVALDVLSAGDAIELFRLAAGPGRLTGEPAEAVAEAVELCGRLPLAIRLLAGRLRKRPTWRLADLLDRLRHGTIEFDTGNRSVAAAFALSYEPLDKDQRRLFRLLGLHPGADFDAYAAAALAELDVDVAERILEELVDVHLLQSRSFGRYSFHDLVRAYAAETAHREDSEPDRAEAMDRLLGYYLSTVAKAMDIHAPTRRHLRPDVPPAAVSPDFGDEEGALAWLDRERANLVAVAGCAVDSRGAEVCQLSLLLSRYLRNGAYNADAEALHEHHLRAARVLGDRTEEALALWLLGSLSFYTADRVRTLDYLRQALTCLPEDDKTRRAGLLNDLSAVQRAMSRFVEARDCLEEAVAVYVELGNRLGEANALCGLAEVALVLGDFDSAERQGMRAIALAEESGDRSARAYSRHTLGFTYVAMARHDSALDHLFAALRLYREDTHRSAESLVLAQLANALRGLDRLGESLEYAEQGLAVARAIRHLNGECEAQLAIGETLLACGRTSEAVEHLTSALDLAVRLEQPLDEARARRALGAAAHDVESRPEPA